MQNLRFKCRICKATQPHKLIGDFNDRLPVGIVCVECLGCGVIGIEMLENRIMTKSERAEADAQLLKEVHERVLNGKL
jgi:hypothetical protein